MPRLRELSIKQKRFVAKLVETGRPVEAALSSYDTSDRKVASSIAHDLLDKPNVQEELQRALKKTGATLESIIDNVSRIAHETDIRPSADTVLKANEHLLKLYNAYPERVSKQYSYSIRQNLTEKSFSELIELNKQKQAEIEKILNS